MQSSSYHYDTPINTHDYTAHAATILHTVQDQLFVTIQKREYQPTNLKKLTMPRINLPAKAFPVYALSNLI